jgi:GDPmannose 4,6-dehydratase
VRGCLRHRGLDRERYVRIDAKYLRPTEVEQLCGDASKANRVLGWEPQIRFRELVGIMLECDLREAGMERPSTTGSGVRT